MSSITESISKKSWNLLTIISIKRLTTMSHELRISKFKISRLSHQFSWSQTIKSKSYSTINSNYRISINRSSTIWYESKNRFINWFRTISFKNFDTKKTQWSDWRRCSSSESWTTKRSNGLLRNKRFWK